MNNAIQSVLFLLLVSFFVYLTIASVLIIINGKPKITNLGQNKLGFDELGIDYANLPTSTSYLAHDGTQLNYRWYPAQADIVLILMHGSAWHSQYFLPLAQYISSENLASVYTPDLRGHGKNPGKRGDIKYINQLEDDLADFVAMIKAKHPNAKLIVGGHSSGGGLAIRFAGSKYGKYADAYLLLSPYLKHNAPTIRGNSGGGWANAYLPRIIGLSMLNNLGITWLNYLPVIDFNMPEKYRDGTETLVYSYRLNIGYAPRNYKTDLGAVTQKMLIVVGKSDESNIAVAYEQDVSKYRNEIDVQLLDGVTHMGIVMGKEIGPVIKNWIANLSF